MSSLLRMYATVDVNKIVLPIFVAKNLKSIPRLHLLEAELVSPLIAFNTIQNRLVELASQISSYAILDSFKARLNKLVIAQFEDHAILNDIKAENAGCGIFSGFLCNDLRVFTRKCAIALNRIRLK